MDQVRSLTDLIDKSLSEEYSDIAISEKLRKYRSDLTDWIPKLEENISKYSTSTFPKLFLEPLFDLIEEIYVKFCKESAIIKIPPESEWGGVVPIFYARTGVHNSVPPGVRGGWNACPTRFVVRGMNYLRDNIKVESQSSLFHLKCVQLLCSNPPIRHVAECKHWCALPTNRSNHEYLITNYLVPGNPPVNVVFLYVAGADAYKVISSDKSLQIKPKTITSTATSAEDGAEKNIPPSSSQSSMISSLGGEADSDNIPISSSFSSTDASETHGNHVGGSTSSGANGGLFSSNENLSDFAKEQEELVEEKEPEPYDPILNCGWATALRRFWRADKAYCDQRFKLIPNIEEGPWAIKLAVGTKPALIGTKLQHQYYRGEGYMEIDIDLGSSAIASKILSMVRGVSSILTVDMAVTIQGNSRDELPERMLCQARFLGMDFSKALPLTEGEAL